MGEAVLNFLNNKFLSVFSFPRLELKKGQDPWERHFAWKSVPTPGYIHDTSWLETVLRRKDPVSGEWVYKKTYTPEEENDLLVDRMSW
ncbi:hypothetical protein BRY73_02755 [Ochrobactrum sp. P6BS-III]|nr:hypothetical protein BRY73_02755 [Ochrobactrum sp. P6BS-III]